MRFRVTWNGVVQKTIAIETPADALSTSGRRYRDDSPAGRSTSASTRAAAACGWRSSASPSGSGARSRPRTRPRRCARSSPTNQVPAGARADIEVEPAELPTFDRPEAALAAE